MDIHDVDNCKGVKQYIHAGDWIISTKCDKDMVKKVLIYVTSRKHTHLEIDNFNCISLTSYHSCDLISIKKALEGKVNPKNNKEVYDT